MTTRVRVTILAFSTTIVLVGSALVTFATPATPEGEDVARGEQRRQQLSEARRGLFEDAPPYPDGIRRLARESGDLLTAHLHERLHAEATIALEDVAWDQLASDEGLELLLIPKGWLSLDEVFEVVDQLAGQVELSSIHVAFPGTERTTIGVIDRLPDADWETTLSAWDEFFTASMEENKESTAERLAELADTDPEAHGSELRYLDDVADMLARAGDGDYPVYAFAVKGTSLTDPEALRAASAVLLRVDLGGFVTPRGQIPSVLTPPQDPARDAVILDTVGSGR